jgi:hypothetical protein
MSATATDNLAEKLLQRLEESPKPLTLKELVKGLPKPKKGQPSLVERAKELLDAELATARVFRYPSGKKSENRYWNRDERHHLRERILAVATTPIALEKLAKEAAKGLKADAPYVQSLVRDLIGERQLHEHKPKGKAAPLFGSEPPPPPLELPANAGTVQKLAKSVQELVDKCEVSIEEVFAAVRKLLGPTSDQPAPPIAPSTTMNPVSASQLKLDEIILGIVEREGTVSLKDLREMMPENGRGRVFDQTVLSLEDQKRVSLSRDFDATHFSPEERVLYVQEGETVFTSIAKRS